MTVGITQQRLGCHGLETACVLLARRFVLLVALLCLLLLQSCGYTLRGSGVDAAHLPSLYVHTERGSRLAIALHRVFQRAGISLVEERDQAVWRLTLSDELRERRVLSVGSSGKVEEYELHYSMYFSLYGRDDRVIIAAQALSLLRDFSFTGTDVLAKADEEELLYQGMQLQAVQIILRRLLSLEPHKENSEQSHRPTGTVVDSDSADQPGSVTEKSVMDTSAGVP